MTIIFGALCYFIFADNQFEDIIFTVLAVWFDPQVQQDPQCTMILYVIA
jgi:hypothetical protein